MKPVEFIMKLLIVSGMAKVFLLISCKRASRNFRWRKNQDGFFQSNEQAFQHVLHEVMKSFWCRDIFFFTRTQLRWKYWCWAVLEKKNGWSKMSLEWRLSTIWPNVIFSYVMFFLYKLSQRWWWQCSLTWNIVFSIQSLFRDEA